MNHRRDCALSVLHCTSFLISKNDFANMSLLLLTLFLYPFILPAPVHSSIRPSLMFKVSECKNVHYRPCPTICNLYPALFSNDWIISLCHSIFICFLSSSLSVIFFLSSSLFPFVVDCYIFSSLLLRLSMLIDEWSNWGSIQELCQHHHRKHQTQGKDIPWENSVLLS